MSAHEAKRGTHSVATLLLRLDCGNPLRGNGLQRMYYGGEGKHRKEQA
jgi:hypothetical protein